MYKPSFIIIISMAISLLFMQCSEENDVPIPEACVETGIMEGENFMPKTTFNIEETVVFKACSKADQYVVWTGDETHNYDLNHGGKGANSGLAMIGGMLFYKYNKPGIYKIVFIATNTEVAGEKKQSKIAFDIIIEE